MEISAIFLNSYSHFVNRAYVTLSGVDYNISSSNSYDQSKASLVRGMIASKDLELSL